MADTTYNKCRYNKKNYVTFLVRVRKKSNLANCLLEQKKNGKSLNSLVTILLAKHYGVKIPLCSFTTRTTRTIYDERGEIDLIHTNYETEPITCASCGAQIPQHGNYCMWQELPVNNNSRLTLCVGCTVSRQEAAKLQQKGSE
jgi:hypothetical protein